MAARASTDPLELFQPPVRAWFKSAFGAPTRPQALGWPAIASGASTLILSPTGSGKTLAAFLWCLDRVMFAPPPPRARRCRVLYISPLKALAVDVERNLRAPLAGIAQVAARDGLAYVAPAVAIRTGDTPAAERARFLREPADILITTPESLYLLLTSRARETLRAVDTVIVDEIHAVVSTKRGAHLALSLERLSVRCEAEPQRIGLSATQRPLDEIARFLGGAVEAAARGRGSRRAAAAVRETASAPGRQTARRRSRAAASRRTAPVRAANSEAAAEIAAEFTASDAPLRHRPVTIVDAGHRKALRLRIEVPVEDMAKPHLENLPNLENPGNPSIWSAIYPRLLDLVREHRSTLIFVNSRRLAERLAGALNEEAGETLVRSHHGSLARAQRTEIEDLLKRGDLRGLVATSSLELGIDMGAIDLVVQIEAPPSVASGLQRIGRGGHRADAVSEGVIFPKFRGDLVACAAVTRAMHEGAVEATRYPRNPLDVLAQQVVAMAAMDVWRVDDLFATVRRAAPFAALGRDAFDGVLDMLSGRYPADEFAELRPRITWDRIGQTIAGREGAGRVAIANGGTIPDRGLYGVFLAGDGRSLRVGELDEEMVFETHPGETFVLGASTWRVEEITHDRVLVSPAPGEPGRMPFWKGDRAGRPLELGLAIGRLVHDLLRLPAPAAIGRLVREHDLDARAAENLLQYLHDQQQAAGAVPDARTVLVERVRDDLGDWRVCLLSPRGGRVHAPWAMAAAAKIREETGVDVETLWSDDGFVVRFPDIDRPPDPQLLVPDPGEVQALVQRELGGTALFAGRFRENAARSLLLPRRRPGTRTPLWQQRKRAADLLAVAARYGSFPILLETYRECLRDVFDMPALVATLAALRSRSIRLVTVDSDTPSPFAASVLFNYVASFLYDGDAPLAERRAQALAVDQAQLGQLVGSAELRDLLDADSIEAVAMELQRLDAPRRVRTLDGVHDLLLAIGDLTRDELAARVADLDWVAAVEQLVAARRIIELNVAGEPRLVAIEDAARYRDALGTPLPPGIPGALLEPVRDAIGDLARRYARTHGPFGAADFAARYALGHTAAEAVLARLAAEGRLVEGEFRPGGFGREWTDAGVLRAIRRRALARLRREVEPVEHSVLGRFATTWQGVAKRRAGADALLDAIEQLQAAPIAASILETEVLASRIEGYDPSDLDALAAAGEVVWVGVEPLGERDGRVALFLADHIQELLRPRDASDRTGSAREAAVLDCLGSRGASFFAPLHDAAGGGYPPDTVDALWNLVWQGLVTNDTFHALRAFTRARSSRRRARAAAPAFRSRRLIPPSAEGRWSLVAHPSTRAATAWLTAAARQLLSRHGVLTREAVAGESVPGGFPAIYPVLKAMEEAGRIRRGYFVAGLGATQFALPGGLDLLRSLRTVDADAPAAVVVLAATDPANPYGAALPWPARSGSMAGEGARAPARAVGAAVILVDGMLAAYIARGDRQLTTYLPDGEPQRSRSATAIAAVLIDRARSGGDEPRGMLIEGIDGVPPSVHPLAPYLARTGFLPGALGFQAAPRHR